MMSVTYSLQASSHCIGLYGHTVECIKRSFIAWTYGQYFIQAAYSLNKGENPRVESYVTRRETEDVAR